MKKDTPDLRSEILHIRVTPRVKAAAVDAAKKARRKLGDWGAMVIEDAASRSGE